MVDCQSLVEFCRAFERHRNASASASEHHRHKKSRSLDALSLPFCDHSPVAAVDIVVLSLAVASLGVLTVPYFKLIFQESSHLLAILLGFTLDVISSAPVAYVVGLVTFVTAIVAWEWASHQARKCGNPYCKGLKKAVEFDIQLESEECVKYLPPMPKDFSGTRPLELGGDHKELEAELKKMAPPNGRTVLICRSRCGCPAGRMEVWGVKKVRRIKK